MVEQDLKAIQTQEPKKSLDNIHIYGGNRIEQQLYLEKVLRCNILKESE